MKHSLLLLLSINFLIYAQMQAQSTAVRGTKIKDNKLYLKKEAGEFRTFTDPNNFAGNKEFSGIKRFSLVGNECAIYVEWQNPLRYQLKWTDSIFKDEDDMIVQDYINKLTKMFGDPVVNLNKNNLESKAAINKANLGDPGTASTDLHYPPNGFKNSDLTFLYLFMRQINSPASLTSNDNIAINTLEGDLGSLDKLIVVPVANDVEALFVKLYDIKTAKQLTDELPSIISTIDKFEVETFKPAEDNIKSLSSALATLTLSNKMAEVVYKTKIADFIKQSLAILADNRELVKKIKPIVEIMENSISIPGDVPNSLPGIKTEYYKLRNVKIEDGKGLHTVLTLVEKEYDKKDHEYKVKSETKKGALEFRRYDPIAVFVSAGVFSGNTKLDGFGVDKDMMIVKEEIDKDNFVAATFLNFSFGPSRYLSPLLQIGIDPTKKYPFMLLGGGFAIPVAKLAITAGAIWTWSQTLTNLQEGQIIDSTIALEQDIKYKFSSEVKGWYLGIQYNF